MMRRYLLFCFFAFLQQPFLSAGENHPKFPEVIDYGTMATIKNGYYTSFDKLSWKLGGYAFNYAPELTPFFNLLKTDYQIPTAIETGTFRGGTTVVFAEIFDSVHTIEVNQETFTSSSKLLADYSNVTCHLGSSADVLASILPSLAGTRILFYLDAHWDHYWPLLDELEVIARTHSDNCIIVIDDFKVPRMPEIPYDAYGANECSIEYVRAKLDRLFTSYRIHYLIPRMKESRAKLVVIPDKWTSSS